MQQFEKRESSQLSLEDRGNQENLCRNGRSQDHQDAYRFLAVSPAYSRIWKLLELSLKYMLLSVLI